MAFPPRPVYPLAIDSDRTLFLVFNTSETRLATDTIAWSDEINIVPVGAEELEIWADNGFATIDGELLYYDNVRRDSNGRINTFTGCARNLGGATTSFNPAGEWVRGFVVAEHHIQVVDTAIEIEKYLLELMDLADRLLAEPDCIDDYNCVQVNFFFKTNEEDAGPCEGIEATYDITLTGNVGSFRLDFGDGSSTTSSSGTHTYAPNTPIDPVIIVSNPDCTSVQTPNTKETEAMPDLVLDDVFRIPIPEIPDFPQITVPSIDTPSVDLNMPPIVFPCIDIGDVAFPSVNIPDISINIPSVISVVFEDIDIPSIITFEPEIDIPSVITFEPEIDIPSLIEFGEVNIPSVIEIEPIEVNVDVNVNVDIEPLTVDWGIIPDIDIVWGPTPEINIEWGPTPTVDIEWGDIPTISIEGGDNLVMSVEPFDCSCIMTVVCPGGDPPTPSALLLNLDDDFVDEFGNMDFGAPSQDFTTSLGIPSEIKVIAPDFPELEVRSGIPSIITVDVPNIPDISIVATAIPTEISLITDGLPDVIKVVSDLPSVVSLDATSLPSIIHVELLQSIPETIMIDATGIPTEIQVTGIPETIELVHNIPERVMLDVPEDLEVPLVYKGGPIPIQFDPQNLSGDLDADTPCFAIVPCPGK